MNIDLARKIDRWCGVPLCFLLSIFNRIRSLFPSPENRSVQKILFIKFSELGALVLAYPLMKKIKRQYPGAELFFATFGRNREIFKFMEGIIPEAHVLLVREDPWHFGGDLTKAIVRCRQEKLDLVFDLEFFSRISAIFAYLASAPKRIGFDRYTFEGLYRGNLLTHKVQYNPTLHVAKNYLALVQELERPAKKSPELPRNILAQDLTFPLYRSDDSARKRLTDKLKKLLGTLDNKKIFLINAGEGMLPLREWPVENFIALAKLILKDLSYHLIVIGTRGAGKKAQQIMDAVADDRCLNWVEQTTLSELLELFSMSHALVSNDCGLAHLAMLTPIQSFILFGPESPAIFGPPTPNCHVLYSGWPCSPCLSALNHRASACRDNHCLKAITPDNISQLISELPKK